MNSKPRVNIPKTIKAGDVVEVRTLISHAMETGNRRDAAGNLIPRQIIHTLDASFEGREVFRAELKSGISANPFIAFHMRVPGPGILTLRWIDDSGAAVTEQVAITIS